MRVIVINLDKSKDRLKKITKNLNDLNVEFERFDAICGKSLYKEDIKEVTTFIGRTFLCNYGIIGCALSHIKIWNEFKKSKEDFIFISEDDVFYNENLPILLKDVDKMHKQTDFDVLSLNCSIGIKTSLKHVKVENYELCQPFFPLTMASYIVSRKGVEKLLKMVKKISYHVDFVIAFKNLSSQIKYYNVSNPVVLNVIKCSESNVSVVNNCILSSILKLFRLQKIDWFMSSTTFTLFLKHSFSFYACILIILMIILLVRRKTFMVLIAMLEFTLLLN